MITASQIREEQARLEDLGDLLYEMTVLDRDELGFDFYAYISPQQGQHGPRVKFAANQRSLKTTEGFVISVGVEPKLVAGKAPDAQTLRSAIAWVKANREVLDTFWRDPTEIGTTKQMLAKLKRV